MTANFLSRQSKRINKMHTIKAVVKVNSPKSHFSNSKLNTMFLSKHVLALLLLITSCLPPSVESFGFNRKTRALHSSSLVGTPKKSDLGHPRIKFTSTEDVVNDTAEDYDFVLDLNEHEDFDRLLNMLSRSGPAKHLDEVRTMRLPL